jgi:hypothetical protein
MRAPGATRDAGAAALIVAPAATAAAGCAALAPVEPGEASPVRSDARSPAVVTSGPPRQGMDVLLLPLTRDGRLADPAALARLAARLGDATDVFVFCHGGLDDAETARREGQRFFAVLEAARRPLGARVVPLRVVLHWPSTLEAAGLWPALARRLLGPGRRAVAAAWPLLADLCAAEIPLGPEEEAELDAIVRKLQAPPGRGRTGLAPVHALGRWVMRRRAGEVGERLGREHLAPLWPARGARPPRLHLIGHALGAQLLTAAVGAGVRPESLTLLQAALSAFAFARRVPGTDRPGRYYPLLIERAVRGPITVLHSAHDRTLGTLAPDLHDAAAVSPPATGGGPADGGGSERSRPPAPGRWRAARARVRAYWRDVVATSALGVVGVRGVQVPRLELGQAQLTGLPRWVLVNVDGSAVVKGDARGAGAHRDIFHTEVGVLVLLAAGLLQGGPDGVRMPPLSPLDVARERGGVTR